jgi:hypothetical protein
MLSQEGTQDYDALNQMKLITLTYLLDVAVTNFMEQTMCKSIPTCLFGTTDCLFFCNAYFPYLKGNSENANYVVLPCWFRSEACTKEALICFTS